VEPGLEHEVVVVELCLELGPDLRLSIVITIVIQRRLDDVRTELGRAVLTFTPSSVGEMVCL
jgi:hypothetical protein